MKNDVVESYSAKIKKYVEKNPSLSNVKLAELMVKELRLEVTPDYFRSIIGKWKNRGKFEKSSYSKQRDEKSKDPQVKSGLELKDQYVINWSDKTIITDLGEYGTYVCSIDRHKLIQRKYVYDHGNETAAIVAMEYDFPHMKAVYIYARIHGFTKSSPPQTDIEFEMGLTVEQAVEENIQTLKRSVYKKTQKQKWKVTREAADKWFAFEDSVIEQLKLLSAELVDERGEVLEMIVPQDKEKFAALIGISDAHYMKLCYDHLGEVTYDRDIAKAKIKQHTIELGREAMKYGTPERFFVIVGNDNLHVDGLHHSTTKLTSQHQATDGLWRLELKNYIRIQIDLIDHYKQIAPVTLIPVKGNHDFETSIALQSFLEIHYENDPLVSVEICHDARAYVQYEKVCLIATHGDELGSVKNLESQAHKLIMGEAKTQGINVMEVDHYILLHGHEHVGSTRDLNGHVQRIGLSSLSGMDDFWHKTSGYVGRQPESTLIIISPETGRKALVYVQ